MRTSLFGLEIPQDGSIAWGDKMLQFFEDMETQLGASGGNLALTADTANGIGSRFHLGAFGSGGSLVKANPSAGRWGRVVPQTSMVDGEQALCRLVGITSVSGVVGAEQHQTIYHDADSDEFTLDPDNAIVADSTGIRMLPLGFAFSGGLTAFVNGLLPLVICPTVQTGQGSQYKPGVNDPSGSFSTVFDSGPALSLTFDASGSQQYIDLIFPRPLPSDFLQWSSVDDANVWGFKAVFKTTGDAQLSVQSVIDTAGSEHAISSVSGTSVGSYGSLLLRQKKIDDAAGTWSKSGVAALRLRCQGSSSAVIRVRPTCLMQYLPDVRWQA